MVTAEVEAPFDHVDIAQWLKTLPTHEYQRCAPPDHKAAGYTVDGTPMSINVEMIGTGLVVQQYRFEVAEPKYCKMVSLETPLYAQSIARWRPPTPRHRHEPAAHFGSRT